MSASRTDSTGRIKVSDRDPRPAKGLWQAAEGLDKAARWKGKAGQGIELPHRSVLFFFTFHWCDM